jgi:hypothetical protein
MARRRGAVAASASKVHPVAVVAKDVEGPVGRQRRHSCHKAQHNLAVARRALVDPSEPAYMLTPCVINASRYYKRVLRSFKDRETEAIWHYH